MNEHQEDLRRAYVRGGPGTFVSGLIWLAASFAASYSGVSAGFSVLFIGGMFIFPLALLLVRHVFKRPAEAKDNPGKMIVIETIFPMMAGLFAAWAFLQHQPDYVFPFAAIAVGAHYFGFRSAYGDHSFWLLGGAMCGFGFLSIVTGMPSGQALPFLIAVIELLYGAWQTYRGVKETHLLAETAS